MSSGWFERPRRNVERDESVGGWGTRGGAMVERIGLSEGLVCLVPFTKRSHVGIRGLQTNEE